MEYLELTRINGCEESLILDNCRPFNIITEKLTQDKKNKILDLGVANNNNINFFSSFYCKLYIENLYESIGIAKKNILDLPAEDQVAIDFNEVFYCNEKKLDIILCWEILNYIPKNEIRAFIESLLKFAHKKTLFHVFIATQANMADTPLEYSIMDNLTMNRNNSTTNRISAPRYNQLQLYKFMPEFKVEKTILHRNGMQEYLFSVA